MASFPGENPRPRRFPAAPTGRNRCAPPRVVIDRPGPKHQRPRSRSEHPFYFNGFSRPYPLRHGYRPCEPNNMKSSHPDPVTRWMLLVGMLTLCLHLPGLVLAAETGGQTAAPNASFAPVVLPGQGLAGHDFFYAGESRDENLFIVRGGKIVWSHHSIAGSNLIGDLPLTSFILTCKSFPPLTS